MTQSFTAVYQVAEEGGYIAFIEELPGANTQGETLEEARENLRDAVRMILDANRELALEGLDEAAVIREELLVTS
jgi:predicted RNase H-like HicB family nuclease